VIFVRLIGELLYVGHIRFIPASRRSGFSGRVKEGLAPLRPRRRRNEKRLAATVPAHILPGPALVHGRQLMACRGVRGATTADTNTSADILKATRELLALMIRQNGIEAEDVASAIFTTTKDLDAEFPALAARQLGWFDVALMCQHELDVPESLGRCIRILLHWNTDKPASQIVHVYIKGASNLRPDISGLPPVDWSELENWIKQHLDQTVKPSRR
jgi:chorismate mutase